MKASRSARKVGRPDHLHAHRFHARLRRCRSRRAPFHRGTVRQGVSARTRPTYYKSKKDAQDAHEAIRPTSMAYSPEIVEKYLAEDEMKLYRLIWNRFVASQMMPASVRPDHHRRLGAGQERRGVYLPRHRVGAQVRRLPQGLRGRQGPDRRGRRRAEAPSAAGDGGRDAAPARPCGRSSISPSRRRATTKPRW